MVFVEVAEPSGGCRDTRRPSGRPAVGIGGERWGKGVIGIRPPRDSGTARWLSMGLNAWHSLDEGGNLAVLKEMEGIDAGGGLGKCEFF